jgi:twitching motility two-component system response regulator PilH
MALILLVDDSPTEVHVMRTALEEGGFEVAVAMDGEQAIHMAKTLKPGLIFMDVVMPGMNGFQATRTIARDPATQDIPVVMVTSKGQETDKIWGMRQGAADYLVKPVKPADLVAKASAMLSV